MTTTTRVTSFCCGQEPENMAALFRKIGRASEAEEVEKRVAAIQALKL